MVLRQLGRGLAFDDRLPKVLLLGISATQIDMGYGEVGVHLQSLLVLVDGLVRVPPEIKNPAGNHAYGKREWIEFLSSLNLGQSFIPAPNYRQFFGVPLMSGRVTRV